MNRLPTVKQTVRRGVVKKALRKFFSPRTWADAIFSRLIPGYYKEWQKRYPVKSSSDPTKPTRACP